MASIIRIKRSTGTVAPASLYYGELGLTIGIGSHGNFGGRLFVGDNSASPDIADTDPVVIGGRYYTDLLSIAPGLVADQVNPTTPANGFVAILDQNRKVNQWNVDNITIDGNKISSTDTNGNIELDPVGTGVLKFIGGASQTFDITDGSTTRFSVNSVNGSVTITQGTITTDNPILSATSTWNDGGVTFNGIKLNITNTSSAAASKLIDLQIGSITQFSVTKTGDTQILGDLNIDGGDVTSNTAALNLFNATVTTANVLGAATAIGIGSITGTVTINNPTVVGTQTTQDLYNTVATTVNAFGDASTIGIGSTSATLTLRPNTVVGVNATQDLYNTTATTVNAFGAATAIGIGATTGTVTIQNPTVVGTQTTQDLYNTVATTVNAFGAATAIGIGATTGTVTIQNPTVVGTQTTQNLYNTTATTVNAFGDASTIGIGATTGTVTINNPTVVGTQTTQNLYNTTATTVNAFGAATAIGIGANSGTLTVGNPTVVGTQTTQDLYNTVATTVNAFGAATAIGIGATTGTVTIQNPTVVGTQTTQNLYNTTATTVNAFGDASTIGIGSTSATLTLRPSTVVGVNATQNLYNTVATTVNAFGDATALVIGATSGIATINNPTVVGTQTTQNLYNTVATTVNAFGAATAIGIGSITGTATIRNATLSVPNATTLDLGSTSSVTSVNFQSTPNTSYVSIAATTNATSTTSGALRVAGGVGIEKDVRIGGTLTITGEQTLNNNLTVTGNLQVNGNTTLGTESTDTITITGVLGHTGPLTNTGGVTIDNIGISSNVISTKSGGGNVLYIDPYPDGLSNEGLVVVKGNLQVDGTTTTVDSSSVTVNGSIISLGDVTSNRTVIATVASGVSTITLDSVVGINTGDIISGNAALPNSGLTTITAYNTATKIITIEGSTSSGITSTTQLTITHAYDTNTDRGISFDYNTGVGTANQKSGFFGFDDSTGYFTYVPDANISNSVVTGTRGYLDIKGIYYQSGDFSTHGVVYFDNTGLQNSTNDPASPTITSKQILTAVTEANITLSGLATVTAGDIILQNTGGAYGVVKTSVASTSIITLIGVEGTFNTTNNSILLKNGSNIGIGTTAIVASVVYTNKPMWTSTLDGGTF